jgi:CHASE2 domain-containing sensor protein
MKQVEGKARRVQKYDRMFYWYIPLVGIGGIGLGLALTGWNWLAATCILIGGMGIGVVLGVLFRDS